MNRGMWGKSALALGVLSVASALSSLTIDGEWYKSLAIAVQIREAAEGLGRLTPFIALLSVLVEPVRYRGWAYAAFVVWAIAAAALAVGNLHDVITLVQQPSGTLEIR